MIPEPTERAKLLVWTTDERSALRFCNFPEHELWRVALESDHDPRGERDGKLFSVLICPK
jgi:hypothetical protein